MGNIITYILQQHRTLGNLECDWLYWYDRDCVRYPTAEERAQQAEAIAMQERQEKLQERQEKKISESFKINGDQS